MACSGRTTGGQWGGGQRTLALPPAQTGEETRLHRKPSGARNAMLAVFGGLA
jgi:hypothetical protein